MILRNLLYVHDQNTFGLSSGILVCMVAVCMSGRRIGLDKSMDLHQQYHFRESEAGLLAWDVLKLIELSKNFEVVEVLLSEIRELKENYWFGAGASPTTEDIAKHAKQIYEADLSFPIILCPEGRVMDGMHRVCKAILESRVTISAVRFKELHDPDYIGKQPHELPY